MVNDEGLRNELEHMRLQMLDIQGRAEKAEQRAAEYRKVLDAICVIADANLTTTPENVFDTITRIVKEREQLTAEINRLRAPHHDARGECTCRDAHCGHVASLHTPLCRICQKDCWT